MKFGLIENYGEPGVKIKDNKIQDALRYNPLFEIHTKSVLCLTVLCLGSSKKN